MTSLYSDNFLNQYNQPIEGAEVYVYEQFGPGAESSNESLPEAVITNADDVAITQPLITNADGEYSFKAEDALYRIDLWFGGKRIYSSGNVVVGDPEIVYRGFTGPANSTYPSLLALKAAEPTNLSYILTDAALGGVFNYETANAPYTADDVDIIKLDNTDLSIGALVRSDYALETPVTDVTVPSPVPLRKILLDSQVSRFLAGTGDGNTGTTERAAETAKFQAMCDTGRSFEVPLPATTYAVDEITMHNGQEIRGPGQFGETLDSVGGEYQFTGNGTDPVFTVGDGTGDPRQMSLIGVSAFNNGASCVVVDTAPNFLAQDCRFNTEGGVTSLAMRVSYRAAVRGGFINASGSGGKAISAVNNMNGMIIEGVTCSGGSAGQAIEIGQSQGVIVSGAIVESSLHGIWVSSQTGADQGNCNGVILDGNYVEQCSTPFKVGTQSTVLGLNMSGNYVGNSQSTVISAREAAIQVGRIQGGVIHGNSLHILNGVEDGFWIWLENASGGYNDLSMERNIITNTPANVYQLKGSFAANASVKSAVGGVCNFGFIPDGIGSNHVREWVSPLIDSSASITSKAWLTDAAKVFGGKIKSAEIIDYDGGALASVQLTIGRTASPTENVNLADMSTLSFTEGQASLTLAADSIFDGSNSIYRLITAGGATGKFRIRIRYRAN